MAGVVRAITGQSRTVAAASIWGEKDPRGDESTDDGLEFIALCSKEIDHLKHSAYR